MGGKKWFFCILAVSILFAGGACTKKNNLTAEKKDISLILQTSSGYHMETVKLGADAAAREFNVNIEFNVPDSEEEIDGQIELVNQALEDKADALILSACDYNALTDVVEKAYSTKIPVIIVDSDINTNKITGLVKTDNLIAGKQTGAALVDVAGMDCRIAVINSNSNTRSERDREEGFYRSISLYPGIKVVKQEYCPEDKKNAIEATKRILLSNPYLTAIVTFNSTISEGAADAVEQLNMAGKIKIVAFDNTPKEIDYLDKNVIQATIIENPFSMGYLSVKYAVEAMNGNPIPKETYTGSKIVTKENMFLPENQKLLFPFVK